MADILSTISIVSFALAAVFLVLAVVFWTKFRILGIIGDLSGRTAKKSIAKMRENNKKTGKKLSTISSVNGKVVKPWETVKKSEKLDKKASKLENIKHPETGLLDENKVDNSTANATEFLDYNDATSLLNEEGTEMLHSNTTIIFSENVVKPSQKVADVVELTMLDEVMLIHTNEVI